jgi:hypothetical protein
MKKIIVFAFAAAVMAVLAGCGTSNVDCNYKGMNTVSGRPISYVHTRSIGYHLVCFYPIMGDGSLSTTFNEFNKEAKRLNGTKVDVVYSTHTSYWYIIPVITWIITPTVSEVAGTVY